VFAPVSSATVFVAPVVDACDEPLRLITQVVPAGTVVEPLNW
jgi:hypothetical protein